MYRIGLSSFSFDLTEENFRNLEKSGIEATEISLSPAQHHTIPYKELAEFSRRYHVNLWSYHLPFSSRMQIDISCADPAVRAKVVDLHTQLIQKASDIGIQRFVLHPSGEPIADAQRNDRLQYAMESLDTLAEVAHKCQAVIAVEDLPRTCLGNTAEEMLTLLNANEKLRVCFDSNHLLQDTNRNFIEKIAHKIITVHISDYDFVDEKHWLPGEGMVDWQEVYSLLQKVGYQGVWMYEIGLKAPETLKRSRDLTFDDFLCNARDIFANNPLKKIV